MGATVRSSWNSRYLCAALIALLTFVCYLPSLRNEFVSLDDYGYVLDNWHIRSLNPEFFAWAFTDLSAGFWHPLTWISYAIDYAVWGLNPFGYHLTAILVHALNTFLVARLILVLLDTARPKNNLPSFPDAKGALIAAGTTALLFGLHPLHVESVAWISERKDILCGLFFLLSLTSYLHHVGSLSSYADSERSGNFLMSRPYILSLLFFVLALASKSMAVSLPVVKLILDWYPLNRLVARNAVGKVLLEKVPFVIASLVISLASIFAQKSIGAMTMMATKPLWMRTAVAFKALIAYLVKMLLPLHLVPLYPFPVKVPLISFEYLAPAVVTLTITGLALYHAQKNPLWISLWACYFITLFPTLGFIQVGIHAMADRFTYLPSLALFLLVGLAVARPVPFVSGAIPYQKICLPLAAVVVMVILSVLTIQQIGIWKSSQNLWDHTIRKGPRDNASALNSRGLMYMGAGKFDLAIADYSAAITIEPREVAFYVNRGAAYGDRGDLDLAIADFNKALTLKPDEYMIYNNRGTVLFKKGEVARSLDDFSRAVALKPMEFLGYYNRASVYETTGALDKAIDDYTKALALNPTIVAIYVDRGNLYLKKGKVEAAAAEFTLGCSAGSNEACQAFQNMKHR